MSAPLKLNKLMLQKESEPDEYVSYDSQGSLLSRVSFKRMWYRLMADAGCATTTRMLIKNRDILKQVKLTLTLHFPEHRFLQFL